MPGIPRSGRVWRWQNRFLSKKIAVLPEHHAIKRIKPPSVAPEGGFMGVELTVSAAVGRKPLNAGETFFGNVPSAQGVNLDGIIRTAQQTRGIGP